MYWTGILVGFLLIASHFAAYFLGRLHQITRDIHLLKDED